MLFGAVSCSDNLPFDTFNDGEGKSIVTFETEFHPLTDAALGKTRGTAGDAIKSINDICVVIFTADGSFFDSHYFANGAFTVKDVDRNGTEPVSSTERQTQQATFTCNMPYGTYHIYAVANMGDLEEKAQVSETMTEEQFKAISFEWDATAISNNNQMSGYFTNDENYPTDSNGDYINDARDVTIDESVTMLHAWLRRAASKVTIAYDATNLNENVYIYLKSVQIKDIPASCTLIDKNTPSASSELITVGESITYGTGDEDNHRSWPCLTKGNPSYPTSGDAHTNTAEALFFYENMQGVHTEQEKQKLQDADGDGKIDAPDGRKQDNLDWKDRIAYGSYIEVQAYYESNALGHQGSGTIIYRFMLGKNITTDYDAERNYHYKLTLKFNNYANDVDWHIDYDPEPGIIVPNPYYISYLYNESMTLPVQVNGNITGDLKAEIIENEWKPDGAGSEFEYYKGVVYTSASVQSDGVWNGFLSLRKCTENRIGDNEAYNSGYNKTYWDEKKEGNRRYSSSVGTHTDDNDGNYSVEKTTEGLAFSIPLYTRALTLTTATGFTGNNPYYSYNRKATVRITATIDGKPYTKDLTIYQVKHLINPAGVYRAYNNTKEFHVVLMDRGNENSDFAPFASEGPWTAEIESGEGWLINNGKVKIKGSTGSNIDFYVKPEATINSTEVKGCIVKVSYHNNTCFHRIMLRQGYAPQALISDGAKWHCYNLWYNDMEAQSPLEEGSLFRWANIDDAIDAVNNQYDGFKDNVNTAFKLAPTSDAGTKKWANITSKSKDKDSFKVMILNGKTCRVASYSDFAAIKSSDACEYKYGVLYGDEADETLTSVSRAFGYSNYNADKTCGMRGSFVYNKNTGMNIFFPIGVAGYGRRKDGYNSESNAATVNWYEGGRRAVLRYANRSAVYGTLSGDAEAAKYRPMFYTIYTSFGALYWLQKQSSNHTAWDFNFSTFDFSGFGNNAFLSNGDDMSRSDAAFIRLVED